MDAKNVNFAGISEAELQRMASSQAGQALLETLMKNGGSDLSQALAAAKGGDVAPAKAALEKLLQNEQAAALLRKLRHG